MLETIYQQFKYARFQKIQEQENFPANWDDLDQLVEQAFLAGFRAAEALQEEGKENARK